MKLDFCDHHLLTILKRFDHQHLPLDLFLSHYFRSHKALGSKDRKQIAESIYEMMRWKLLIDYLLGEETSWERRYSIYKAFQPQNYISVNTIPLNVRVSFPKPLFDLLKNSYGIEKAVHIAQISNTPAPMTVRVNPQKTSREALLAKWADLFEVMPTERSSLGIQFKKRTNLFELEEFKEGWFEVQDEGSQLVAELVDPKPGNLVLDYCSGSGGKTLAFAHKLQGRGQCYLHDIRTSALEQARKRLKRAGIQNAQVIAHDSPHLSKLKGKMDIVVVDAPCSGTGTMRRNPDMKWKFEEGQLTRLVAEQKEIFEKALSYLAPNGELIYITCSLLKEENEEQVEGFLAKYPLELKQPPLCILPSFGGPDGFFAAVFKYKH